MKRVGAGKVFLAVDLGASNGRVVAGVFDGRHLRLEELHRFQNGPVSLNGTLYWDILHLFSEIKTGIAKGVASYSSDVVSVGVDCWGVDYGLLNERDELLGNPYHYRDQRTDGMQEEAFSRVSREEIYRATGIQFLFCNTLYQLLSDVCRQSSILAAARSLLFTPDLINFWLTGRKVNEHTIASTSQLLDPWTGAWCTEVMERLAIPPGIFCEVVAPGSKLGGLLPAVAEETQGGSITVVAPGCHDTASAVAAVPVRGDSYAYLSSGTWSLMGLESEKPIISERSLEYGFSNEGGVCGTFRVLKNISGLWLVQECRRAWTTEHEASTFEDLTRAAEAARPFSLLMDPDDPVFLSRGDMPGKIADYCRRSGQQPPGSKGEMIRSILESLALKYRFVLERLEGLAVRRLETLHIVGGGSLNRLLNQFAADAVGRQVVAGPVEATSLGNILMQMLAMDHLESLEEGRNLIRDSFEAEEYDPSGRDAWIEAYDRFRDLLAESRSG